MWRKKSSTCYAFSVCRPHRISLSFSFPSSNRLLPAAVSLHPLWLSVLFKILKPICPQRLHLPHFLDCCVITWFQTFNKNTPRACCCFREVKLGCNSSLQCKQIQKSEQLPPDAEGQVNYWPGSSRFTCKSPNCGNEGAVTQSNSLTLWEKKTNSVFGRVKWKDWYDSQDKKEAQSCLFWHKDWKRHHSVQQKNPPAGTSLYLLLNLSKTWSVKAIPVLISKLS